MKKCIKCLKVKNPDLFYNGKAKCKKCINAILKESRESITDSYCIGLLKRQKEKFDLKDLETNIMIKRVEVMAYRLNRTVKQLKKDRL